MAHNYGERICLTCMRTYQVVKNYQRFCSIACRNKDGQLNGSMTTTKQYQRISGNWSKYLKRLIGTRRKVLTAENLCDILEKQNYKCALTGVPLTCHLEVGKHFLTNASIDRVIPGGPYSLENIRLVCWIVNVMKWNMSDTELKGWCQKILKHDS